MISRLIILGASGDLVERSLLPGLGDALAAAPDARVTVVGVGRSEHPEWADLVRTSFASVGAVGAGYDTGDAAGSGETAGRAVEFALANTRYEVADGTDAGDLARLLDGGDGPTCLYLSLPPDAAEEVVDALAQIGAPEGLLLAIEKPVGTSAESARGIEEKLAGVLPADRVLRVDHFLGMSGVLGLLGLRFGNAIVEPLLSRERVARVEIVFDEVLGLEGRADFYDETGAARDMIQSHLLQVMAVLLMEPPATLGAGDLHAAMGDVLRATRLWAGSGADVGDGATGDDVGPAVLRGRYTAGTVDGERMPDYVDEEGVDPERETETFARLVVEVDTPRWRGVPVVLRSGKAIGDPAREIRVVLRGDGDSAESMLRMGFEDGHLALDLTAGDPTSDPGPVPVTLSTDDAPAAPSGYEVVMRRILAEDLTMSVAPIGPEHGWRIMAEMDEVIARGDAPLREYEAGSDGPDVR